MKKVKLTGAKNPEEWGWKKNPKNGIIYNLEDIPSMYGAGFYETFTATDLFIEKWHDESWEKRHGKWEEVKE